MLKNCWSRTAAWLGLLVGGAICCAAAAPHYTIDTWDGEKGLPEMAVISLAQTRDGYLWLGTGDGLARFDGVNFRRFEDSDSSGLSGSKVVRLFEDRQGNLWMGTENGAVSLLTAAGKLVNVPLAESGNQGPLVNICEDISGGIWLRMAKGQVFWYGQGQAHLVVNNCRGLMADNEGFVWVGSPDGRLLALGPLSHAVAPVFPLAYEMPVGNLDFLLASRSGGFWCLANGRIQRRKSDHLERDYGAYPWHLGVPVLAACEDRDGNLVVGTYSDGVWWMQPDGTFKRIEGLPPNSIWCLVIDHEGNLWVGSNGGGLLRVKQQSFHVLEGTRGSTVQSVCEDTGGGLWIGHNSERIDHWTDGALERFTELWPQAGTVLPGRTRFYARTVLQDRAGRVWAGGNSDHEITNRPPLLELQDGAFAPARGTAALNQEVWALYQDKQGVLWAGTQAGLARLENDAWKFVTLPGSPATNAVRAIAEDHEGNLWVGTDHDGLSRLRDGSGVTFRRQPKDGLPSDGVTSLYVDGQGVVWVGTTSGLARYDHGQWTRYSTREGLASSKIGYITEDDKGNLWIGSNAGLMRLSLQSLAEFARHPVGVVTCRTFGKSDGLPSSECSSGSQPGACRTRQGLLCFPTISGLVLLDPARLHTNTNPPPVVIEALRIDEQPVNPEAPLRSPPPQALTVPAGSESVEVLFAALNLSAPEKGFFKYRLQGFESGWTLRPGNIRSARYARLPHGHYTFQVLACNEDGVWNEQGASLALTVLPPFWQTWWFLSVSTAALLALIVGSVHYVSTQKLQRQLALLRQQEALEKERARIARDLHDQLGANLTQVALLGEMAEADKDLPKEVEGHAKQICQTARETTRALDEVVWTVNPSNDTLDGLVNYVCKYAQEYLALAGLRYRLDVPAQLPAVPISPEVRHNVFLAAKEAVNNLVKHAQASAAWVRLHVDSGEFVLEVEDNGRGLAPGAEQKRRNGLKNMRKRLEDVGGRCEFGPGAEGGTKVKFIAPLGKGS